MRTFLLVFLCFLPYRTATPACLDKHDHNSAKPNLINIVFWFWIFLPQNLAANSTSNVINKSVAQIFLSVFNISAGNEMQPGSYNVDWDASNYPSGVYFYKLESGSFVESKKMVLIK